MRTLNLGILAHVDAGKTTLTERLLFATGAIDRIGSVDDGTTQTDYLALERERGITIRSAVASFAVADLTVNILDTPGHPDFIAEVERVLSVLDAAILVVSAVEGIQPQTPLLMRALQRMGVPTLLFINKIDRAGADTTRTLDQLRDRLGLTPIRLGSTTNEGTREAAFVPGEGAAWRMDAAVVLAEHDDELLADVVESGSPSDARIARAMRSQLAACRVQPVVLGSALTGSGIRLLLDTIAVLLPAADGDDEAPLSGRVFKIERAADGARTAITRLFSGRISMRDQVAHGDGNVGRVTQLSVYEPGGPRLAHTGAAGQIVGIFGLREVRVGDIVGQRPEHAAERQFPPPTLEATVAPLDKADRARMRTALNELAEQDPLINVRQDSELDEISVSLYGDVQREVIQATLEREYGVRVSFHRLSVICTERPLNVGYAEELISAPTHTNIAGRSSPDSANPYRATLGLRVAPSEPDSGVQVAYDISVHLVPLYIYKTVRAFEVALSGYIQDCLRHGLHGWPVIDCLVTVCDSGYSRTGSTARDFRLLTGVVLRAALEQADTVVCEPMTRIRVELPTESSAGVGKLLGHLMARVEGQFSTGEMTTISARVPTANVTEIKQRLPGLTSGQGVLETDFGGYEPVVGPPPERHRH